MLLCGCNFLQGPTDNTVLPDLVDLVSKIIYVVRNNEERLTVCLGEQ